MPPHKKSWWIKERENPQLGTYYVALGELSKSKARRSSRGRSIYGASRLIELKTEVDYLKALEKLKADGHKIQ